MVGMSVWGGFIAGMLETDLDLLRAHFLRSKVLEITEGISQCQDCGATTRFADAQAGAGTGRYRALSRPRR